MKPVAMALPALLLLSTVAGARTAGSYGTCLTLSAATTPLSSSFQRGTVVGLLSDEAEFVVTATLDGASNNTGVDFEIQVSDDLTNWDPVVSTSNSATDGSTQAVHTLSPTLGATLRDRLVTQNHRNAKYVAIAARFTGTPGAAKAGDAASSSLNFSRQ